MSNILSLDKISNLNDLSGFIPLVLLFWGLPHCPASLQAHHFSLTLSLHTHKHSHALSLAHTRTHTHTSFSIFLCTSRFFPLNFVPGAMT